MAPLPRCPQRRKTITEQATHAKPMDLEHLKQLIIDSLESLKAVDIRVLDVRATAGFTDLMFIASGNSSRQVKALANRLVERCKAEGVVPLGVEGEREAEWILVDLGDAVVHIMNPDIRAFYNLEKLWSVAEANGASTSDTSAGAAANS